MFKKLLKPGIDALFKGKESKIRKEVRDEMMNTAPNSRLLNKKPIGADFSKIPSKYSNK